MNKCKHEVNLDVWKLSTNEKEAYASASRYYNKLACRYGANQANYEFDRIHKGKKASPWLRKQMSKELDVAFIKTLGVMLALFGLIYLLR